MRPMPVVKEGDGEAKPLEIGLQHREGRSSLQLTMINYLL